MPSFSFQVDNRPVFFTLLNVPAIQFNCLMATYATREQDRPKRSIAFFLQRSPLGARHKLCDCSKSGSLDARFRVSNPTIQPWTSRDGGFSAGRYRRRPCSFVDTLLVKSNARFIPVAGEIPQVSLF
jgi:hypothetical protein